jgi:hypothetical protein
MIGLTREDPALISFVTTCLWSSAITPAELRAWCDHMVSKHEVSDLPDYIFELSHFDEPLIKLSRTIGFETGWRGSRDQEHAILGIAARRGHDPYEWPVPPAKALESLRRHPQVLARFREVFPFIEIANDDFGGLPA